MRPDSFVLKGDLCCSAGPRQLEAVPDGYLVCVEGRCAGMFPTLPEAYRPLPLLDCSGHLVIPGLVDLHVHAPQYAFRGLGMDLELLDWLNLHAFPEESRYRELSYAGQVYRRFAEDLRRGPNTRACVFATVHAEATLLLMELLEDAGLCTLVGKVNMDRNCPDSLREPDAAASAAETRRWLERAAGRFANTAPILTPRFIPSCSDGLLAKLHALQQEFSLPVQSHLSETVSEVEWVAQLCPDAAFYGDAYDRFGLFGGPGCPTVMAHCVHSGEAEIRRIKQRGVFIAHCPASNTNLASGIAPARRYLDEGLSMGLGSDVAGGTHTSIFRAMADAIQVSKLRWRLMDGSLAPLTAAEAFYLATAGGGAFFGQVGIFAPGYELDALVIREDRYAAARPLDLSQRLERTIYLSDDRDIVHKFVRGRRLF